jgi:cytochrome c oxidase assembly protein subunit 15
VFTVCAALPLLLLGAEVTTKDVGMVDPEGFRAPWYIFTVSALQRGLGYVIEHSHRVAGFVVGICSIVLALGLWLSASDRRVRWIGLLALAAVSAQGILGIYRVNRDAQFGRPLALIHGCFAQIVFAILVSVAVLTSRAWNAIPADAGTGKRLRRLAQLAVPFVYAQVIFGAVVRHFHDRVAQRLHVVFAFAVLAIVLLLVKEVRDRAATSQPLRRWARTLTVLLTLQLVLGVEAWLGRFGSGELPELQHSNPGLDLVRSGHYLIGALLFAATVVVALLVHGPELESTASPVAAGRLGGVE